MQIHNEPKLYIEKLVRKNLEFKLEIEVKFTKLEKHLSMIVFNQHWMN